MSFSFRIRVQLPPTLRIQSDESKITLLEGSPGVQLSVIGDVSFSDSHDLKLTGSGYEIQDDAESAGRTWISAMQVALSELEIGADFGYRRQSGRVGPALRESARESHGVELLAEPYRLHVYPTELNPMYVSGSAKALTGRRADDLGERVRLAVCNRRVFTEQQTLAYHLFSASFFEINPDSRLVLLVTAIETLIERNPREDAIRNHVASLIGATKACDSLTAAQIEGLCSGLSDLKKESITQAGRRLTSGLSGTYGDDQSASDFFADCYKLRSKVVHGSFPRPDVAIVSVRAGQLRTFVANLLVNVART
jgi:hypothetical protein